MSQFSQVAIAILLSLSAIISLAVAGRAWQRKGRDGRLLAAVLVSVGIWLAGYAAELLLPSLSSKLFAARVQYLGIATVPSFWLLFALSHTSRHAWIRRWTVTALFIIPAITIVLAWTSSSHGLLWSEVSLDAGASASGLMVEYGTWFWIHTAYSYLLLAISNIALITMFVRALRFYRRQASLMLVGLLVPWLANIAYLAGGGASTIDPTALGLAFSGILLAWGIWRWRLLDVKPIPRTRSVENMRDGVVVLDHQFRIVDVNLAAASLLEFGVNSVIGQPLASVLPDLDWFQDAPRDAGNYRFQRPVSARAGDYRMLEASVSPLHGDGADDQGYWIVMVRDITEQDRVEQQLRAAELRYRTLVEQMPAVTYIRAWSDALEPTYLSPQIQNLLGYAPEAICSDSPPGWEGLILLEDLEEVINLHRRATEQQGSFTAEYRLRSASGRVLWVRDEAVIIADGDGQPLHWQGVIVDITTQKQLETQLERYAFYDMLTGLPNRALLLDRLQLSLSRIEREKKVVGVLFLDLDGFKIINDALGHAAGDLVLKETARRLTSCLRTGDTAGRLGGDEFVVIVESIDDPDAINQIADRIITEVRQPITISGRDVVVSCSVGIRTSRSASVSPEDLLRDADVAMYWAKSHGRSQAVIFDQSMLAHRWNRLGLEAELRSAINANQLDVTYQPIVSLRTGRITGFEALLRWVHPERGEILPDEFLPIAEESGLIVQITRWMLETACRQVAAWQARLSADSEPPLSVGINISPVHIQQPSIIADIEHALEQSGLAANQLILEITESHTMQDAPSIGERLEEIRRLGVKVVIDDFGTGYAALAYLRQFSIAGIKIDRSFVSGLGTRAEDTSLINALVSLARAFDLEVIAEGVETVSQWTDLGALGADHGQGHFIARPLSPESIDAHIAAGDLMSLTDLPKQAHLKFIEPE